MYFFDKHLQYPVKVETPDPLFARQLQQAIGGIEGEIRACMQYFFQAWGIPPADMYCNVAAETTGRVLAVRLYQATKDPGMEDMLSFLIARDTMHQQQWLAVIEEMGGNASLPIPNSFDQSKETQKFS